MKPLPGDINGKMCPCCGSQLLDNFCGNCGQPQPAAAPTACPKCGWQPADPTKAPKFCPECGERVIKVSENRKTTKTEELKKNIHLTQVLFIILVMEL